jgi:hypothetical protein
MDKQIIEIINKWNPIEINPLLKDEYHSEAKLIIAVAVTSDSIDTLGKEIFSTFKRSFGSNLLNPLVNV